MATILVVDDVAANREFLATLLRYKGHRLREASHGAEALDAVRAERPDLIVTDVLMPVMDGYEFVRQLRLDPATRAIPVVFYTAHYGEREARALAHATGVSHVLTKPAEPEEVLTIVEGLLAGAPELQPSATTIPPAHEFDREHLRLLTDKLSEKTDDLKAANARLRALINIGLELASESDTHQLLYNVSVAARDLFGATYVTIGIVDRVDRSLQRLILYGTDATNWFEAGQPVPGVLRTVVSHGRTLRGETPDGDPTELGLPVAHPPVSSFLIAPISSPAHIYGWICLVGNEGRRFDADDEDLVKALAGQAGRIYENSYFYSVAQRRTEALEHEVAERKRAESEVRHERDRAQRYLDTAEVILLALDEVGRITRINRYGCDILGWTAAELLGRDWIETCLPVHLRTMARRRFDGLLHGDLSTTENAVVTTSGAERLIEWRNTLLRDADGNIVGTFSSGTDITERTEAVRALRTAEERMRFALESADVGIWDMDYTTGVLEWSETLEAQFGLQRGTFEGTFEAFIELIHPDDRVAVLESVERAMRSGRDFSIQHRTIRPDGNVRWLTGAGRIHRGQDGEPLRGIGISLDITERHSLEAQYQQAQKMEAVGRLAGGIAHDFNNLLTAILGYCELLMADLGRDDPHRDDVVEIHKAGTSAAALTRQLLAFSRKQIIEPTLLDLNDVVSDLRPMLERIIGEDVEVVLGLDPNLALVQADRGQVDQIVLNLAVNARDAMPKGGTLRIETANVELDDHYAKTHIDVIPGWYVVLTLTDTGTGITPEVQARLFEPFFTTKEAGKGTGLGLATVHGIVKGSSGSVQVYSEVGKGTAFKVYFPRAAGEHMVVDAPRPAAHVRAGDFTVLVVDDADGLRELVQRLLQREGYNVLVAGNSEEALRRFAQGPPIDVMLTDVVMPGSSGPELTAKIVERHPSLKVIYMSGYTEDAIVQHGVLLPGIAFLNKPFTSEALARKVLEVLDR
jgi:PAS domain S-box-containing protein